MNCLLCGQNRVETYSIINNYKIVRCLNDGLIYLERQPSMDEYKNYYTENYFTELKNDGYGNNISHGESNIHMKKFGKMLDGIEQNVPGKGKILDVGCAFGFLVKCAADRGWDAYGVELNEKAVNYATKTLGANVFKGTLTERRFPDNYFDAVCLLGVIEHFTDPLEILNEIYRISKKDALLVITTGNVGSFVGRRATLKPPEHLFFFSRKTLKLLIEKTGFSVSYTGLFKNTFGVEDLFIRIINYIFRFSLEKYNPMKYLHKHVHKVITAVGIDSLPVNLWDGQIIAMARRT